MKHFKIHQEKVTEVFEMHISIKIFRLNINLIFIFLNI